MECIWTYVLFYLEICLRFTHRSSSVFEYGKSILNKIWASFSYELNDNTIFLDIYAWSGSAKSDK